jgi:hypothetical protein
MAKKKAAKKVGTNIETKSDGDDARIPTLIRLDARVHVKLTEVAQAAGVTMNRLIADVCAACASVAVKGTLKKREHGKATYWQLENERGFVSFGREAHTYHTHPHNPDEVVVPTSASEADQAGFNIGNPGFRWFSLNYTESANAHGIGE